MFISRSPFSRTSVVYLEADTGANATGGTNGNPVTPPDNQSQPQQPNIGDAVKAAISELLGAKTVNGDKDAALEVLVKKNHRLETEIERLKTGAVSDADKSELQAWRSIAQELGLDKPETAKARIQNGDQAIEKASAYEQEKHLGKVAEMLELKPNSLFKTLANGTTFEIRGEGDDAKVVVKDGDNEKTFEQLVEGSEEWRDALPALKAETPPQRAQAPAMGVSNGKPVSRYDAIRQEVQNKTKPAAGDATDLKRAGIY